MACQPNTGSQAPVETPAAETTPANPIKNLFEDQIVVKMHLFATQEEPTSPEDYPYTGKAIEGGALQHLGESLKPAEGGQVFACYRAENNDLYILRYRQALVLAKWDASTSKLEKVMDLAHKSCGDTGCQQQDAWLTDLDDNRSLELVVRSRTTDAKGKVTQEDFTVLVQDGTGKFVKSDEQLAALAVQDRYILR